MIRALVLFLFVFAFVQCKDSAPQNINNSPDVKLQKAAIKNISINDVMGKFDPSSHSNFVEIDLQYASRSGMYLHKEAYDSFKKMYEAARQDDVKLTIKSAARNFDHQKRIWEAKWDGRRLVEGGQNLSETTQPNKERALIILKYSSMPGSSRHHWGTDIDINAFENSYFESGQGLKEYTWLMKNAPDYGFCQTYTAKDIHRPNGYYEEKWHWSYLPVALPLTQFIQNNFSNEMITGFKGAKTAVDIDIKNNYMLGINQACIHPESH